MVVGSKRAEEKTKHLHRLLSILRSLDNRERINPRSLASKFNTSIRTIQRDMQVLNNSGFAIVFDKEHNMYRFADSDYTLRDLNLTENEIMAIIMGSQVARNIGAPFEEAFKTLLRKAHKDTADPTKMKAKVLGDESRFFIHIDSLENFEKIEKQYRAIEEAMTKGLKLEITYHGMKSDEITTRLIAPYGLIFNCGLWYVIGYCYLREEIRVFALDCIKKFKLTTKPYTIPRNFNIEKYLEPGWSMIRYGKPVEVVLEFSNECARWIKRRKWHPTQRIEEKEDGSIIFSVTVEGTRELKWWTYHWIPYCKVIKPPELREEIKKEIKALARVYGMKMEESEEV